MSRLRELFARPGIVASLAVHDVFTGLIAERAGLELLFLGGFGVSASMLGLPDLNFLTATEMAEAIRRLTARVTVPVVADGDTGHGEAHNVRRTVELFEAAGAAGILLEDQVTPKRCGHFANKQVVPTDEFVRRIEAAVSARRNPDFVIFARSDARQMNGLGDAIARVNAGLAAGAEAAFVEAPQTLEELAEVPRRVPAPLLANMLTGGATPIVPVPELGRMGYKVAVAPVETLMVTARAVRGLCEQWLREGRVDQLAATAMNFAELKDLLGVEDYIQGPVTRSRTK